MTKSLYVSSRKSLSSLNAFVLVFLKGFHWVKRHAISTLVWSSCSHSLVCLILIVIIFRICIRISLNCWNKKQFSILYGILIKFFFLLAYDYHIFPEQLHRYSYLFLPWTFSLQIFGNSWKTWSYIIPSKFCQANFGESIES